MDSLTELVGSALLQFTEKAGWTLPIHVAAATANGAANVAICIETGDGEVKWEFLFSDGMPMQLPLNINVRGRERGPTFAEKPVGAVRGMRTRPSWTVKLQADPRKIKG
jgi:hypothetical protein